MTDNIDPFQTGSALFAHAYGVTTRHQIRDPDHKHRPAHLKKITVRNEPPTASTPINMANPASGETLRRKARASHPLRFKITTGQEGRGKATPFPQYSPDFPKFLPGQLDPVYDELFTILYTIGPQLEAIHETTQTNISQVFEGVQYLAKEVLENKTAMKKWRKM